jgi:hypothetical protein
MPCSCKLDGERGTPGASAEHCERRGRLRHARQLLSGAGAAWLSASERA